MGQFGHRFLVLYFVGYVLCAMALDLFYNTTVINAMIIPQLVQVVHIDVTPQASLGNRPDPFMLRMNPVMGRFYSSVNRTLNYQNKTTINQDRVFEN